MKTTSEEIDVMPGVEMQEICDAILDAYTESEAKMAMRYLLNFDLDREIDPGTWQYRVFNLVGWAERNGRDVELVLALGKSRPKNARMREVYEKYGLSMPAVAQKGGEADPAAPATDVAGGLEELVRDYLGFEEFDVWLERMTQVGGRVCLITLGGKPRGTGFLVGPDAVLTNFHVMEPVLTGGKKPTELECVFDFKKLTGGGTGVSLHASDWNLDSSPYSPPEAARTPDKADPTADQLDYALVRLAKPVGSQPWAQKADETGATPGRMANRGWEPLPSAAANLKPKMGVIIAQHPAGQPLKLAIDTDALDQAGGLWLNKAGNRLRYATNTLGGSSGSPVFDLSWNLIALHHYGDPTYQHTAKYNQGVPIHLVRERLLKNLTAAKKEKVFGGAVA